MPLTLGFGGQCDKDGNGKGWANNSASWGATGVKGGKTKGWGQKGGWADGGGWGADGNAPDGADPVKSKPEASSWGTKGEGGAAVKTKLCNGFAAGTCTRGDACNYAHGEQDLGSPRRNSWNENGGKGGWNGESGGGGGVVKTKLCNGFVAGTCTRGDSCNYAHGEKDLGTPRSNGWTADNGKGKANTNESGKSWGKGKANSKGQKRENHKLPRTRVSGPHGGVLTQWKGKYGWIEPAPAIEHPKAADRNGNIFISSSDFVDCEPKEGMGCLFYLFEDSSGLGGEECHAV